MNIFKITNENSCYKLSFIMYLFLCDVLSIYLSNLKRELIKSELFYSSFLNYINKWTIHQNKYIIKDEKDNLLTKQLYKI